MFTCTAFLPPPSTHRSGTNTTGSSCDLVTGGDNGFVFLFRKSNCVAVVDAFHKGVCASIHVSGPILVCGGSRGGIVQLNSSSLDVMQTFSALPDESRSAKQVGRTDVFGAPMASGRPKSSSGRSSSAPRGRPGTAKTDGSRPGAGGGTRSFAGDISGRGKARSKGPASQWEGPRDRKKVDDSLPSGVRASTEVLGLVVLGVSRLSILFFSGQCLMVFT